MAAEDRIHLIVQMEMRFAFFLAGSLRLLLLLDGPFRQVVDRGRLIHLRDEVAQVVVVMVLQWLVHRSLLTLEIHRLVILGV